MYFLDDEKTIPMRSQSVDFFKGKIRQSALINKEEVKSLKKRLESAATFKKKMSLAGQIAQSNRLAKQSYILYQTYIDLRDLPDDCLSHYIVAEYQRYKFGQSISKKLNVKHFSVPGRPPDFRVKPWSFASAAYSTQQEASE